MTDTAHKKVVQYKLMLEDGIVDVFAHYEWKFHPEIVYGDVEGSPGCWSRDPNLKQAKSCDKRPVIVTCD